ncbi:MAG: thiolase family protein [Gemmatimonadales bacterium]|nr:thiolase family protein [Gemmatimonadales bacterium]MDQ3427696.1 thiolase family protein [Gemmatimonadota bacterium]
MNDAWITGAVRTPVGRAGGALAEVRPDDLAAAAIRGLVDRLAIPHDRIDDVILGCVNQAGEDNRNVARMALLLAGLPVEVPGQTVNRLCGSGLQAVASASHAIRSGEGELILAGGVESMTRAPYVMLKPGKAWDRTPPPLADSTVGWRFTNPKLPADWTISLGETAERVARARGVTRKEQDEFALESQRRAQVALAAGWFQGEIVGVELKRGDGSETLTRDEPPRPDVSLDSLARLRPAFLREGTVTAGTSSGINDGAAALCVASAAVAAELGMRPLARVLATAVAGVDPSCMGLGPVPATRKALARAGLEVADLDLIELNEAFAAQAIACIRDLGLDPLRVNIGGGAIALGHPLGASGARILTTLVHALRRTGGRYGLATMCIGVGQGIAMVVESVEGGDSPS